MSAVLIRLIVTAAVLAILVAFVVAFRDWWDAPFPRRSRTWRRDRS